MLKQLTKFALVGGVCSGSGVVIGWNLKDNLNHLFAASAIPNNNLPADFSPSSLSAAAGLVPGRESRTGQIMKFGFPGYDELRTYDDFVLSYDRRNRTAQWVFEHLTPDKMVYDKSVDRSKCQFKEDSTVHPFFRSSNSDYKGSGFDRGHLAAAGNHRKTQASVDQTFFLTNMSPQVGRGFNRDKWNDLEKYVRKLARKHPNVYVCTGPLYLPRRESDGKTYVKYEVIGKSNVAVPTHFFKVILAETGPDRYSLESFLLPNAVIPDDIAIKSFHVPLDSIERSAGFLIFSKLPKNLIKSINGK